MNVFVATIGAIFFDFSHYFIIALPLKEFIPGYSSSKLKEMQLYWL
jgi:hypothetical protein